MVCSACNSDISDDSEFCEECGNRTGRSVPDGNTPKIEKRPVIAIDTGMLQSRWRGLLSGEKLAVVGAVLAFLSFFLPWISISLNSPFAGGTLWGSLSAVPAAHASGFDFGRIWGGFYLWPIAAIACLALTYYGASSHAHISIARANAVSLVIASIFGPQMLLGPLLIPLAQQVFAVGWFLTALGFCIVGVGSFINVTQLSRSTTSAVTR